jgi:hypothetical protein
MFVYGSQLDEQVLYRWVRGLSKDAFSPLKPLCQMNRNLVGSILVLFSIMIAHLVPIRKQTWPPQVILGSDWLISENIFSSGRKFQKRTFFRDQPSRNKNCLWRPCLLTGRNQMSNLYRGPSKDASYEISINLAKGVLVLFSIIIAHLVPIR